MTDAPDDEIYGRAVAMVRAAGQCSVSAIQRQLGLGYNLAALIVAAKAHAIANGINWSGN